MALVTGAGAGIGACTALRLAAEGAWVCAADVDAAAAASTVERIRAAGGQGLATQADVSLAGDNERMVSACVDAFGTVDVLFANAGIAGAGTAVDLAEDEWDRVIGVNLKGVWLSAKHVLPVMTQRRSGSIVATASVAGMVGVRGILPYAAAKGGVIAMTRQMAVDFGPYGIRVNAVCPGTVPTQLVTTTYRDRAQRAGADDVEAEVVSGLEEMAKKYPLGRLGEVDDVAAAVAWLASDDASWITGAVVPVDGGYTAA